jgi:adenine phosphoribosyltransferase
MEDLKEKIRKVSNWPKPGVNFYDITTLLADPPTFQKVVDALSVPLRGRIEKIAALDARGFIVAAPVALNLQVGFVPIRKKGKLPFETEEAAFEKEYGPDILEIHKDAVFSEEKVALVDDIVATGGSALAACELVEKLGGRIEEIVFVVDLPFLGGSKKLLDKGYNVTSLISYDSE